LSEEYGLLPQDIDVLLSLDAGKDVPYDGAPGKSVLTFFESVAKGRDPKTIVNWIVNELFAQLMLHKSSFSQNPLSEGQLGALIDMVNDKRLTGTAAKEILRHIVRTGANEDIPSIQASLGLAAIEDDEISHFCETAIKELPEVVDAVRKGNTKVIMKLVGKVMSLSGRRADAQVVRQRLQELLMRKHSE